MTTWAGRLLFRLPNPYPIHAPVDGCPWMIRPVFIWSTAEPWANESLYMDFTMASLSMCLDRCGSASEHHKPDWPNCLNLRRLAWRTALVFVFLRNSLSIP